MTAADKTVGALAIVSTIFWVLYSCATRQLCQAAIYYVLWTGLFGCWLWRTRIPLGAQLKTWRLHPFLKFVILGYGAVLAEEIIAALANNISEGFSFSLYLTRIGQFWAFNVFAFTGFILGWYVLLKNFSYTARETFYLAGAWGLFSEGIYRFVLANPVAAFMMAAPTVLTYGLILAPASLSMNKSGKRTLPFPWKLPLTYGLIFALSLAPMFALTHLREQHPQLFPPEKFIPK